MPCRRRLFASFGSSENSDAITFISVYLAILYEKMTESSLSGIESRDSNNQKVALTNYRYVPYDTGQSQSDRSAIAHPRHLVPMELVHRLRTKTVHDCR
eukprot:scaffold26866_cov52-Attheya_sp.AAC.3